MYLQKENRQMLACIFGIIIFLAVGIPFGWLVYKHWEVLNLMIKFCFLGGMVMLLGGVLFMVWPESYFPILLLFVGLAEQGLMLLIYLDVKLTHGAAVVLGISAIVAFCLTGIVKLKLRLSDSELQKEETAKEQPTHKMGVVVDIKSATLRNKKAS
ncbi:hypothetical protein JW911_04845 [Candidatus Peregrinibacteria bacterium]|nr:hypothetical protein [Candidatus Peregrinibacteria bacterium]